MIIETFLGIFIGVVTLYVGIRAYERLIDLRDRRREEKMRRERWNRIFDALKKSEVGNEKKHNNN